MRTGLPRFRFPFALLLFGLLFVSAPLAWGAPILTSAAGPSEASIQAAVDAFRLALGDPNNGNAAGPLATGRREINWDGGGSATSVAGTPFAGFQNNRGAQFQTPGTGFVQAPASGLATQFSNPSYATVFDAFSEQRLFVPIGSTITDVFFFIPGTMGADPATVTGFGAVFSDVDLTDTTHLEFFDPLGNSLGEFDAFPGQFSFLGVIFDAGERIARVRITSGNAALGPNDGGGVDVVAIDDLLYREPQRLIGEPSVLALLALGALLAVRRARSDLRTPA